MKKLQFFLMLALLSAATAAAQTASNIVKTDLGPAEADRIVQKFTENEKRFRDALTEYVFNRNATIQTIGMGGQITGVYHRQSFMTFTSDGKRFERITYFPMPTLTEIRVTPEDLEDLGGVNPFALEPTAISQYNFTYLGKEKIDDLDLYVFDVTPKEIPNPKKTKLRLFTGRVWVDDRDLMIVKSKGKAVPETEDNKFPVVETWRENVDGKYWFPAYSAADDELVFDNGFSVRLRMRVKYSDYKQGDVKITIEDDTSEVPVEPKPEQPKNDLGLPPPPTPAKKP